MLLGTIVLVLAQAVVGMVVNFYVTVPSHHPGAHPRNYFNGSFDSVVWSIGHGATPLAIHASLGLALVVMAVGVAIHGLRLTRRSIGAWSLLGGLLVIGAGFNGASFLDFSHDISSLIMSVLAFAAIACYATALFLTGQRRPVLPA